MSNVPQQQDWGSPQAVQGESGFDFVGMLQRRIWIIVLCVILATCVGVFWFWKSDVVYSSVARTHIYFQNPNVSIIGNEGFATTNSIRSHHELIRSESVLTNAAKEILKLIQMENKRDSEFDESERLDEIADDEVAGDGQQIATDTPDLPANQDHADQEIFNNKSFAYLRDKSAKQISQHLLMALNIAQDRDDPNIYQVTYSGPSRKDCHVILGIVIAAYENHLNSKYENQGKEVLAKIREANKKINEELDAKKDKLERWRTVDRAKELSDLAEGFLYSKDGSKSNLYRTESQLLYEEIKSLEKQKNQLTDDQNWIKEAKAANMSNLEILTHINKFSQWLQLEDRKRNQAPNAGPELSVPAQFEEPEPSAELIQARFQVTSKKLEIKELEDRGFGENFPGRRRLQSELKILESRAKLMEDAHQRRVDNARIAYQELKKKAEELADIDTSELPKILSEINLINLQESYLEQQLLRIDVDLKQLNEQRDALLLKSDIVDQLLREEREMESEIAMQEALHTTVLQKISEIDIEKDNGGYTLDIINSPSYGKQTEPSALKIFAITTFIGLVLGAGLGYLVEIADKTFRSPAEIAQQLGMQVMGHVPILSTRKVDARNSRLNESLIAFHLPKSQQSEAFRAIRTNLFFNAQGKDSQIIQVTSPTPGDGKSTLASNLAVSLAQSGKRVLLMDADLRRPTVEYLFSTDTQIGFSSVLKGDCTIDEAIIDCEVEGLQLMPVGKRPPNPSELLTSSKLFDIFEVLREKFDFIIVDSPPMLAVTDPCAVAARADGVILAMRIKKNVKLSAARAKEVLDSVSANIMGIVVNGAGMVQGNYSNSAAYGYGYGYGSGDGNYYSYGYDYGESSYYYDEDTKPTTTSRS